MANSASLVIKILADASNAQKELAGTASSVGKFQAGLSKAVVPAAAVAAGLAVMGKSAIDAASDLQQAQGGVDSVFKGSAGTVHEFARAAVDSAGLSESAYSEMATIIGSQLKNAGVPMDQLAGKTNDLISTGADMAAMFGGTSTDAVSALSSALKGEMDPIEKYGVTLNQAAIQAQMAADGTDKLTGKQGAAAKQAAILEIITLQTADAHGKFASEANTAAGQTERSKAAYANAAAAIGTALLPAVTAVAAAFAAAAKWVQQNSTLALVLGSVIGALAVAIIVANGAMKLYALSQSIAAVATERQIGATIKNTAVQTAAAVKTLAVRAATLAWTAAQWLLNAALSANPIGLVIAAVVLLIAGIVLLWKKNEGFRNFVIAAWKAIQAVIAAVWRGIKAAAVATFNAMRAGVAAIANAFRAAFNGIRSAWAAVSNFLRATFASVGAFARNIWNGIRNAASSAMSGIRAAVSAVRSVVLGVWSAISGAAATAFGRIRSIGGSAINALLGPIHAVAGAWQAVVSAVSNVIGWISRIHFPSMPSWLTSLGSAVGLSTAPVGVSGRAGTAPPSGAVRAAPTGSTGGGVVINVTGALDPDAVARQISSLLARQNRRRNGVDLGRTVTLKGVV